MGHYWSEMQYDGPVELKFCNWKHPHLPHDHCPGYQKKKARNYSNINVSRWTEREFFGCPDCGALVKDREIHDKFHEG